MKTSILMACVFASVLLICIVILQLPSPLNDFTADDCVRWLQYDIAIHRDYLQKPSLNNGNERSHQQWIDDFTEIIARIKREPSKLTKQECIELLLKAQSTHAGNTATDYSTVKHHWEWYNAYSQIIAYMKNNSD